MTALSCRQYDTRMHVAMMIDAYVTHTGKNSYKPCDPGNTFKRMLGIGNTNVTDQCIMGIQNVRIHSYSDMWENITFHYGIIKWNKFADYEIDRNWEHARLHGMKINNWDIPATAFIAAQLRWERNGWLRYEFKRSKRRAAVAPFLRVIAIV